MIDINCNICKELNIDELFLPTVAVKSSKNIFSAAGGIRGTQRIVRCNKCNLIYVSPRFNNSQIIKAYTNSSDHGYSTQSKARKKTFEKGINLIEKIYGSRGKLLDVGCANGSFIEIAQVYGWKTVGVELSRELVYMGKKRNLEIYPGTIDKLKYPNNYFDVITYWDVLEHISDPSTELNLAYNLLKNDGLILINFPDIGSFPSRISGSAWWFLLSVHLYYFSRKSITKLLEKTGFVPIYYKRHWQYLELGYLAGMLSLYSKFFSRIMVNLIKILGVSYLLIPYYAGQTTLIAKKR